MGEFTIPLPSQVAIKGAAVQLAKAGLFRLQGSAPDEFSDVRSYLGRPVFDEVIIKQGSFFALDDLKKLTPIPFNGLTLHAVLLTVTQSKNIIKTAIQGRNGTIKEHVSDGDFLITMNGTIVGGTVYAGITTAGALIPTAFIRNIGNAYPEDDAKSLVEICKVPQQITIISNFLNTIFGINEVVITDYDIPQLEATRNMQPFKVDMSSDTAIELNELEV